jgi:hypothetical protein
MVLLESLRLSGVASSGSVEFEEGPAGTGVLDLVEGEANAVSAERSILSSICRFEMQSKIQCQRRESELVSPCFIV